MVASKGGRKLKLYEALELRAEFDARIKTLKDCLPEAKENRGWLRTMRDAEQRRPSPDFDLDTAREAVRRLELKRRKLNGAIQQANFHHQIDHGGETITLSEALETRKSLNEAIGELHSLVVEAAWQRVIYKEDRDIVEENEASYTDSVERLDQARLDFRELNRKLRAATFEVIVDFRDE
jgi:hypothetical protein